MSTHVKLSVAEYDALSARGAFEDLNGRYELLFGELEEMSPPGPVHDLFIRRLDRWSHKHTAEPIEVGVQTALGIPSLDSIPLPDVSWIRPGQYRDRRPEPPDVLLLIEVADSSLLKDMRFKRDLYAQGGVEEYWVIDVENVQMHVYRKPLHGAYSETRIVAEDESIAPLAAPDAILELSWLFR